MSDNRILEVVDRILYLRENKDEGAEFEVEESKDEMVTVYDAANAILSVTDDLIQYIDIAQAAAETRMIDIIKALPEDVQDKIKASFSESEDDLLEDK